MNTGIQLALSEFHSRKPSLLLNAFSNYVALIVNIAIGIVLTPFIVKALGKTGYGIWTIILTFIGYYGVLTFGVHSATARYVALCKARCDENGLSSVVSTALAVFCLAGLSAIFLSLALAGHLARFFEISPERIEAFRHTMWIMGIASGLSFPSEVFSVIVKAHERYAFANCIKIAAHFTRAGLIVALLTMGYGLFAVAWAALASQLLSLAANWFLVKRQWPHIQIAYLYVRRGILRKLGIFGGITLVIAVADHIRLNTDNLIIGKFLETSDVCTYAIAAMIINWMRILVNSGMVVLTPRFASLWGAGDTEQLKKLFTTSLRVASFLSFGCCMGVVVFGKGFISLWMGKDFIDSVLILWILVVPSAITLSQNTGIGMMMALKKHHFYAVATMAEAIANLVLSIVWVSKYGIVGVALGTAIPMAFVKLLLQPIYVTKIVGMSLVDYVKAIIPFPAISAVFFLLAYFLGVTAYADYTYSSFTLACLFTGSAYCLVSYLQLNRKDRRLLLSRFGQTIGSLEFGHAWGGTKG